MGGGGRRGPSPGTTLWRPLHCRTRTYLEERALRGVDIDPRKFLDVLHAMLRDEATPGVRGPDGSALDRGTEEAPSDVMDRYVSKYFFKEDPEDGDLSDDLELGNGDDFCDRKRYDRTGTDEDPWSLQNIMQAMGHELRIDGAFHQSIKGLSVASEETSDGWAADGDLAVI